MSKSISVAATVKNVATSRLKSSKTALTMTANAVRRIKDLLATQNDAAGVKIGVRTRGCSGLQYTLEYSKEKGKFDEEVVQDGVRVFIDSKALMTLLGTEMDFVENKLSKEFVFHNPNVKSLCGCGESFNV